CNQFFEHKHAGKLPKNQAGRPAAQIVRENGIISNGCAAHGQTSGWFLHPPCRGGLTLVEFSLHTSLARPAARSSTACGIAVLVPWQSQTCAPPEAASLSRRLRMAQPKQARAKKVRAAKTP